MRRLMSFYRGQRDAHALRIAAKLIGVLSAIGLAMRNGCRLFRNDHGSRRGATQCVAEHLRAFEATSSNYGCREGWLCGLG